MQKEKFILCRVGDADREGAPRLDVLHGFVIFTQIQRHGAALLHGSPGGVHHIHAAIFVIGCNHQNRHGENPLCDFQEVRLYGFYNVAAFGIHHTDCRGFYRL